jgi:hypothetical protein
LIDQSIDEHLNVLTRYGTRSRHLRRRLPPELVETAQNAPQPSRHLSLAVNLIRDYFQPVKEQSRLVDQQIQFGFRC